MWTLADASKAARANQLPEWLSEEETAAFGKALRAPARRRSAAVSECWWGQFQGQFAKEERSRNSKPVVYLAFSRGEVAERLKAAVC
jgi:hypothetical protein